MFYSLSTEHLYLYIFIFIIIKTTARMIAIPIPKRVRAMIRVSFIGILPV